MVFEVFIMNIRTRNGLEILGTALFIGVSGNLLLRETPWGLNAFLFVAIFVSAMFAIAMRHRPELLTPRTVALQAAMVFFASMFLIRDAGELLVFDTFAIIILMGVLVLPNFGINQRVAGTFHYGIGVIWAGLISLIGPFLLLGADVDWKEMPGNRLSKSVFSVLRGLAIALPLFVIFGALFMAADAAFENFANRAINFDVDMVISHIMITSLLAWLTAGYFRGTLIDHVAAKAAEAAVSPIPKADAEAKSAEKDDIGSRVDKFTAEPAEDTSLPNNATVVEHINKTDEPNASGAETGNGENATVSARSTNRDWQNWDNTRFSQVFTLGTVETVIILGLINLLFLSFVIFQLPYLFGGMELVQSTPDLKLADYARRGFGELVAVAALVLPILLASHWLLRREKPRNETIFRVLAGIQVGLLFVIMASAMQRLVLLTGELGYGWTTVRFYPMVLMIWLAVVFVWFGWTVLRGHRNNFAWGALWSAIVILGATNLMNPHDFIARKNIELMQQGREYDANYNHEISSDAVPAVFAGLSEMNLWEQCTTKLYLHNTYRRLLGGGDLRSFNLSRQRALQLLSGDVSQLEDRTGCEK
jgi:hypothetical protein